MSASTQTASNYGRDHEREPFEIQITKPTPCLDDMGQRVMLQPGEIIEALDFDAERQLWITREYGSVRFTEAVMV